MPRKTNKLTTKQKQDLTAQLEWDRDEFDVEVIDGPCPENPGGRWRVQVILGKRSVILYQPTRGKIKLDARSVLERGRRMSTGASDINAAISRAQKFLLNLRVRKLAEENVVRQVEHAGPDEVTIGLIHDLFRREGLSGYEAKFRENLTLVMDLVEAFSGRGFHPLEIDEKWVKDFIHWRASRSVTLRRKYADGRVATITLDAVAPVTALGNAKDYDHVLRFAHSQRRGPERKRLLPANPLREIKRWPKFEKALRERASDELYELLMTPLVYQNERGEGVVLPAPVDACDPSGLGILRTVVALQYHTARRREAVLGLRCSDVVTDKRELTRVLRKLKGAHRVEWADVFRHGVIVFRGELDKNGYARVFPMSRVLRSLVDGHLERLGAAGYLTTADAPLFPRAKSATETFSINTMYKCRSVETRTLKSGEVRTRRRKGGWYTEALYLAREYLERLGQDPDVVIPTDPDDPTKILDGFKAHAWRRWWATKLERLGYGKKTSKDDFDLDRHVNFMGSWTILGGGIREERYVQLDPHVLCAIANFEDGTRFLAERARFEQQKTSDLIARVTGASPAALTIKEESA